MYQVCGNEVNIVCVMKQYEKECALSRVPFYLSTYSKYKLTQSFLNSIINKSGTADHVRQHLMQSKQAILYFMTRFEFMKP